jgi:hypothetical protein
VNSDGLNKVYQPLIISVLVHVCLVLLLLLSPASPVIPEHPQDVEIVYQNETEKKESQQIVTDVSPLKEAVDKLKEKVKRLSAVSHRVLEEQVARNKDTQSRNGADSPTFPTPVARNPSPNPSDSPEKGEQKSAPNPFEQRPDGDRPSITAPMGGGAARPRMPDSSISDYIPEVKEGGFTALNQDQFVYYTFYARINEQVRNRWVANIRNFLSRTPQAQINKFAEQPQVTQVEIIITPDGKFVRAVYYRKSEAKEIDDAAAGAFRLAAPFNNPPSELVEKDGLIHLYYMFHIEFRPGFIARDGGR